MIGQQLIANQWTGGRPPARQPQWKELRWLTAGDFCQPKERQEQLLWFPGGTFAVVNCADIITNVGRDQYVSGFKLTAIQSGSSSVEILGLNPNGQLQAGGEAALVRVPPQGAHILIQYETAGRPGENEPNIVIRKVSNWSNGDDLEHPRAATQQVADIALLEGDILVRSQNLGDRNGRFGEWLGGHSSSFGIEGFRINPWAGLGPEDIRYRAIIGQHWESPWVAGGEYCGSRGIDFPICGIQIQLTEAASKIHSLTCCGLFQGGQQIGPVKCGEACFHPDYRPLIGLRLSVEQRVQTNYQLETH